MLMHDGSKAFSSLQLNWKTNKKFTTKNMINFITKKGRLAKLLCGTLSSIKQKPVNYFLLSCGQGPTLPIKPLTGIQKFLLNVEIV
jgi:hypothetical protein